MPTLCVQGSVHISCEEQAWSLKQVVVCLDLLRRQGPEAGVGCLELMVDSPYGSSRPGITCSVWLGSPWMN